MATILAVDDDPATLRLVEYTLRRAGHEVVATCDSAGALELASSVGAEALVLDVMMPGLNGLELVRRLRNQPTTAGMPVLMLSALGRGEDRVAGLAIGADDYLAKPFEPDELAIRIARLVARRGGAHGEFAGRLGVVSMPEILQFLLQAGVDGVLAVTSDEGRGELALGGGAVRDARFGALAGSDAVLAMLDLESARFTLHPGGVPRGGEIGLKGLQQILMTSAWIADELSRRPATPPEARLLPAFDDQGPPTIPEGFETLPFFTVWRRVLDSPGLSLAELESGLSTEPRLVRLTVSVLLEVGALRQVAASGCPAGASPGPGGHELQTVLRAIRKKLAPSAAEGSPVPVLIAIEHELQAEFLEHRHGIPSELVARGGGSLTLAWRTSRAGSLVLGRPPEQLAVDVVSLDSGAARDLLEATVDGYAAVAVWTRDLVLSHGLRWLVDRLRNRTDRPPGRLIVDEATRGVAATLRAGCPGWRLAGRWPGSFVELLQILAED